MLPEAGLEEVPRPADGPRGLCRRGASGGGDVCAGHGASHQEGGNSNLSRLEAFLSSYRVRDALARFGGGRDRGGPQAQAHVWMSEDDVLCSGEKIRAGSALVSKTDTKPHTPHPLEAFQSLLLNDRFC